MKSIRNIGILAHVDAGKTTITEQMLFHTGELRQLGSVDKGTAVSDNLSVERERGISVRAAALRFLHQETVINLIDTPGHSDFIGEVMRSLAVLDAVILVISAAEGLESQTRTLWQIIKEAKLPCIFFINKIDRMNADVQKVLADIRQDFTPDYIVLQKISNEAQTDAAISNYILCSDNNPWFTEFTEAVAESDDDLLTKYLEGNTLTDTEVVSSFVASSQAGRLYPVLLGSAKHGVGISPLLDAVVSYLPPPVSPPKNSCLAAQIFKITHDTVRGRLSYLRLFSASLRTREIVSNVTKGLEEKINQIFLPAVRSPQRVETISAGDVAIVSGLNKSQIGDWLGSQSTAARYPLSASPFLVQVVADNPSEDASLADALAVLNIEEPNLNFNWDKETRELSLEVMGYIHIQILKQTLVDRFRLGTQFSSPAIIYKETPQITAHGYEEYTMPKPCWAVCKFRVEPGNVGSGVVYISQVSVNKIAAKYQKEIARSIPDALSQGILGWEVTDIVITMVGGEDHEIHSRPGNFKLACNIALMRAFKKCQMTLLEPILSYHISIKEEKCGRVMSDIIRMRGTYQPPSLDSGIAIIKGTVPAATTADYPLALSSLSGGQATISISFTGYARCNITDGHTKAYRGINPLDRSKYILKMRGAIVE